MCNIFIQKMDEIEFVYTVGKRVDSRLVYTTADGQLFKKYRDSSGVVHYNCYKKKTIGCTAKIFINNGVCKRTKDFENHSHANQREEYETFKSEHQMKRRSQSDPSLSVRKIVNDHLGSSTESLDSAYRKHKSTLYYNRHKVTPKNPTTIEDAIAYFIDETVRKLLIRSIHGKTMHHQVISNEEFLCVIFASEDILNDLPKTRYAVITTYINARRSSEQCFQSCNDIFLYQK